jgi:hypothetical protein
MEVKGEVNLTMEMEVVPCAGNAGARREDSRAREANTEGRGNKEKGVATWRPKCQESSEPYCLWYLLLLLLGLWSCIVSISFYSDGLSFSR